MKRLKYCAGILALLAAASFLIPLFRAGAADVKIWGGSGQTAVPVAEESGKFGARVRTAGRVLSFAFTMPTWSVSGKYEADLSVYRWDGAFKKTLSVAPVFSERFTALIDNAENRVKLPSPLEPGEYLFVIENTKGSVGVWSTGPSGRNTVFSYADGVESQDEPFLNLEFEPPVPEKPLEELVKVEETNAAAPVYREITEDQTDLSAYSLEGSLYPENRPMPDTWSFTDGLGRRSLTNADVGDPREDRTLALFYWTWHVSQGASNKPFNVQRFLDSEAAKGTDISAIINDYSYPGWPAGGVQNFWDEPVYGYYRTNDPWVLRRHAELLANAGVDVVFTDNTNGTFTWKDSYVPLYRTWTEAQKDGVASPKISFMLPFAANNDSLTQLKALYYDVFREGEYRSLWYWLDGKPMLMAHSSNLKKEGIEKEIREFFTFRANVPGYTDRTSNVKNWGWLSMYPQTVYYASDYDRMDKIPEQISVGVAQNHNYVTRALSAMNGPNCADRTYTSKGYDDRPDALLRGANFDEQFTYALEVDPKVIFVTGWNEWIAGRYEEWQGVKNAFPDEFNALASRDLEPSRGVLQDHYYYQFVNYVRRYKGVRAVPEATVQKTVDVTGDVSQWKDVGPYFAGYIGNALQRDAVGYGGVRYADDSARNDLIGAQMARDPENIYILVECSNEITPCTDPLWMNVYLDVTGKDDGWCSFNYVINKTPPVDASTAVLERFTGSGYESKKVADVRCSVNGRYLQIAVPKSALGISGDDYTVEFAVTDNVHDRSDHGRASDGKIVYSTFSGDILDFYTSGDVMPGARFKFCFVSTAENSGSAPEVSDTADSTDGGSAGSKKGCGSAAPLALPLACAAFAFAAGRKKKGSHKKAEGK